MHIKIRNDEDILRCIKIRNDDQEEFIQNSHTNLQNGKKEVPR